MSVSLSARPLAARSTHQRPLVSGAQRANLAKRTQRDERGVIRTLPSHVSFASRRLSIFFACTFFSLRFIPLLLSHLSACSSNHLQYLLWRRSIPNTSTWNSLI